MAFPDIDGIRKAFDQLPVLGDSDIRQALESAGKTLPNDKVKVLSEALNVAVRNYFTSRLWQLWAAKAPASKTERELAKIEKATDKLVKLLGITVGPNDLPKLLQMVLALQSDRYAENIGGYANLPPREFVAVRADNGTEIRRKDYQGDVKLSECLESLLLLQTLLHRARTYERRKVKKGKTQKRHEGDEAVPMLFNTLNEIWIDAFEEIPGTTWNAYAGKKGDAGGPYIKFLLVLFGALKSDLPAAVKAEYPKLGAGLPTTPNAIRARFKASGVPALKRLAERMA